MLKKLCLSANFKKLHCRTGLDGSGRVRPEKIWSAGRTDRDFQVRKYRPDKTDIRIWWIDRIMWLTFYRLSRSIAISNHNPVKPADGMRIKMNTTIQRIITLFFLNRNSLRHIIKSRNFYCILLGTESPI
jgi:hypothetical protein